MSRSDDVTIRRTGQPALRLTGYGLAAQSSSRSQQGPTQNRWHDLELWADDRVPAGEDQPHCVVVRYCTQWQGELGHDHGEVVPRRGIGDVLRHYDPVEHLTGFPPGQHYEAKQAGLQRAIRAAYDHAVSGLLEIAHVWEMVDPESRP